MVKRFDHLTIVVRDIDRAKAFFSVLGFKEALSVVIAGEPFAATWAFGHRGRAWKGGRGGGGVRRGGERGMPFRISYV